MTDFTDDERRALLSDARAVRDYPESTHASVRLHGSEKPEETVNASSVPRDAKVGDAWLIHLRGKGKGTAVKGVEDDWWTFVSHETGEDFAAYIHEATFISPLTPKN